MQPLPYDFSSARVYTDTKRMAKSHASTAIRFFISSRIHRHQSHGQKPCIYCHTIVHQPANTQTPNAWVKTMHVLPYYGASARVYTDTNAWPEAMQLLLYISQRIHRHQTHGLKPCISAIRLCISTRIQSHQTHGLKPCINCHFVHQYTYTESSNAWPKAMHLLLYSCASASEYTDTKHMA